MILEELALASAHTYDPSDQALLPPGRSMAINGALLKAVLMSESKSGVFIQALRAEEAEMGLDRQENY